MDWTKAKNILIIALILANVMLIDIYLLNANQSDITENSVSKNTIALLKSKNIDVKTEIPDENMRMPVLSIERMELNQDKIQRVIDEQSGMKKKSRNEDDYINYAKDILRECGLYSDWVRFIDYREQESEREHILTFGTVYDGYSVEESYLRCTMKHGRVVAVDAMWYNPIQFGETKKKTMPATTALIKFMSQIEEQAKENGKQHEDITITKIEMVYWRDAYNLEDGISVWGDTAFPSWKIVYHGGKKSYIPAYEQ